MFPRLVRMILLAALLTPAVEVVSQPQSWYSRYTGTIASYPVTVHLHRMGPAFSGYYYYNSRQQPIYLNGTDSGGRAGLMLYAGANEVFEMRLSGNSLTGTWKKDAARSEGVPVRLTKSPLASMDFDMVFTTGSVMLRPRMEGSPAATYDAASIWPKGNTASALTIKRTVREQWDEKAGNEDIGKIFLREKKAFFTSYLEEYRDTQDSFLVEYPYSYNMDETRWILVAFHSRSLLTLADYAYAYTGGAHGNYSTEYLSFDLASNRRLRLEDVLNGAGLQKLPVLLEKYFRQSRELRPGEDLTAGGLFENWIEPNENFYVTAKGIGFSYAPYEIGPYAAGEINVFIPFTELSAYLQPSFRNLLR